MQVVGAGSTRVAIGIQFAASLDQTIAKEVNFKRGVIVAIVNPDGPASAAGIRPKDVIVSVDHHNVSNGDDLVARVNKKHVGDKVDVEYIRDGRPLTTSIMMRIREDFVMDEWDFTTLDPLTISAELGKASTVIHFKGSNNGPVGQQIFVTKIIDSQPSQKLNCFP
jgi:predicted metalloprotease with PDZ domain